MRYIFVVLAALSITIGSAQGALAFEPLYVGMLNQSRQISACLDKASAQHVLTEQQRNGAAAAQQAFEATGNCFTMQADFIALRVVDEVDMGTHVVRIVEVGSIRDTGGLHLFIMTEAPLLAGITA